MCERTVIVYLLALVHLCRSTANPFASQGLTGHPVAFSWLSCTRDDGGRYQCQTIEMRMHGAIPFMTAILGTCIVR